jgi:hypothetical protein
MAKYYKVIGNLKRPAGMSFDDSSSGGSRYTCPA